MYYRVSNGGTPVIKIGTTSSSQSSTSFNISSYSVYKNFTINNFFFSGNINSTVSKSGSDSNDNHSGSATCILSKSYNQSSGILTVEHRLSVNVTWVGNENKGLSVDVYLIPSVK